MSTLLPSAKPVAEAARPAYELSSEITTGMSAPPMGSTSSTPSSEADAAHRVEERCDARDRRSGRRQITERDRRMSRCSMTFWPL